MVLTTLLIILAALRRRNKKLRRNKKKNRPKYWIHPILTKRLLNGFFHVTHVSLKKDPQKFFEKYRMSPQSFDHLLKIVGPSITKKNTMLRNAITAEERLSLTLSYLADGSSFNSLHYYYLIRKTTVSRIVQETCIAIWENLKSTEMVLPTNDEDWRNIARNFYHTTNFPNCLGALDGKHIRCVCPRNGGSLYFNYKSYHSVVLMALVDANFNFIMIDVGSMGQNGDSTIFKNSNFGRALQNGTLPIPSPERLPSDDDASPAMPYVFIGDEAFPLSNNLLRPYPGNDLDDKKRIFNYRLSRARRMVECAFGILSNKWRIFHQPLNVQSDFADHIIKACCILHNFVHRRDGVKPDDNLNCPLVQAPAVLEVSDNLTGSNVRDYFSDWCQTSGYLEFQNNVI